MWQEQSHHRQLAYLLAAELLIATGIDAKSDKRTGADSGAAQCTGKKERTHCRWLVGWQPFKRAEHILCTGAVRLSRAGAIHCLHSSAQATR